jgi:hypothetical protein
LITSSWEDVVVHRQKEFDDCCFVVFDDVGVDDDDEVSLVLLVFVVFAVMSPSIDVVDIFRFEDDDTLYMLVPLLLFCGFVFDDEGCCILSELSAGAGVIECDVCDVVVCFDFWLF